MKETVSDATARNAVCNDGTPAIYYFRPGTGSGADKWVVFLQGGGSCSSVGGCEDRRTTDRNLTTSAAAPEKMQGGGIMSGDATVNPDFYNWNMVHVHYCSSDAWVGNDDVQGTSMLWRFHGYDIVGAVIGDLSNSAVTPGSNITKASQVIFSGSSAGAAGAQQNLDRVASMLPNVTVTGVLDSIWGFAVDPFGPVLPLYPDDTELYMDQVNPFRKVHLDDSCMAANPSDPTPCGEAETLAPYLTTPFFVYRDQKDPVLFRRVGVDNVQKPDEMAYWENTYLPTLLNSISNLSGIFSPSVGLHTSLGSDRFYSIKVDGLSFADVLGNWYFNRSGPKSVIYQQ